MTKTKVTKRDRTDEILPLDPRDPDILRAKDIRAKGLK